MEEVNTIEKELPILIRNGMIIEGEFLSTEEATFSAVSYNG